MNRFLIRMIMLPAAFWQRLGADNNQLRAILTTKLAMDERRRSAFNSSMAGVQRSGNHQLLLSMFMNFLMGGLCLVFLVFFEDTASGLILYLLLFFVMMAFTVITDFTEVLIDVRDNFILLARPVNDATVALSRLLHTLLYLSRLVIAFALPALVYLIIAKGLLAGLLFLLQMGLTTALIVFTVNLLYLLTLRFVTPYRFREIINRLQIAFSVIVFMFYFFLPELIDPDHVRNVDLFEKKAVYLLPPAWIASLWRPVIEAQWQGAVLVLSWLALLVPLASLIVTVRYLSRNFNRRMVAIAEGSTPTVHPPGTDRSTGLVRRLGMRLAYGLTERAGFEIGWQLTGRLRDYKFRVYPGVAFVPIYFFYLTFRGEGSLEERYATLADKPNFLLLFYLCAFLVYIPWMYTFHATRHQAGWIFFSSPVERPGALLMGVFKAVVVRFLLPFYFFFMVFAVSIWGPGVWDDALLALFNLLLVSLALGLGSFRGMPFSKPMPEGGQGEQGVQTVIVMILLGLLGTGHFLVLEQAWIIRCWALLAFAGLVLVYYFFRQRSWKDIQA